MTGIRNGVAAVITAGFMTFGAGAAGAEEKVMIVFDGSNSMWGQINGVAKIEIARGVMDNLLGDWTDARSVGLMAYGHRQRGDCSDIETLIDPAAGTRGAILERINGITPTGKTPLTDAVELAARAMSYEDSPATVILISDGLESCKRDPCALAEALEQGGVGFTAHVVGFGLGSDEDTASLACIAETTGGEFITAADADELGAALTVVGTAVAAAQIPEPAPEPDPEPDLPEVSIKGPETAVIGSLFTVSWQPTLADNDYVSILHVGADEGTYGNYLVTQGENQGALRAPSDIGLYELRYIARAGNVTLGRTNIEIVDAAVTVSGPEKAITGQRVTIAWTGAVDKGDYVSIVPMGSDEGTYGNYQVVRDETETALTAPADPGLYEIRYILREGNKTLATQPIEIGLPEVTVSGPDRVVTGASFELSWTGTVAKNDYVAIVPMGSEEGTFGNYQVVRDKTELSLTAPADPGLYELRYILREGNKTMASQPIEVALPEVTVSGPATVRTGEEFTVSYTGTVAKNDYIAIVPMGAEEGTYGNYQVVRDKGSQTLKAPAETGLYELRYILREGAKTMASQPIEVIAPEVAVSGPERATAGSIVRVSWTGTVAKNDYVAIVPMGADEGTYGNHQMVRDHAEIDLVLPGAPGMYELRYILREGNKTMATHTIEAVAATVEIGAPAQIRLGDPLTVTWSTAVNPRDYINLVPMGADDNAYGAYQMVRDAGTTKLKAPDAEGLYELRYVLREDGRVLARQTIEVLGADAALNTGASLTAPTRGSAGSVIEVSWEGGSGSADQRITLAGADQAIFTWISAVKLSQGPVELTLPEERGTYELRFLDVSNQEVLARQTITVE